MSKDQRYIALKFNTISSEYIRIVTISCSFSFAYVIDSEFDNPAEPADSIYTKWASAGSNAVIDSVFSINVTAIPDSVTYVLNGVDVSIPSANATDGIDDSFSFSKLIIWMRDNIATNGIHAQIYIPAAPTISVINLFCNPISASREPDQMQQN
ncbi:MAG: hypothetical protein Q8M98_08835 [Candidatus Cloacimonadaceae bacterium]|nr:hypothetical protein [Candidatus Cloacimonadaceae bacterium]